MNDVSDRNNDHVGRRTKILIVDDEIAVQGLIRVFLEKCFPCETVCASSVDEAVELFGLKKIQDVPSKASPPFDTAILDVVLPDGNGFDLCNRIKQGFPRVPVMMISGYNIAEIEKRLVDSNADDFLTKPFNLPEFKVRMRMMLEHAREAKNKIVLKKHKTQPDKMVLFQNSVPYVGEMIDHYLITEPISFGKENCLFKVRQTNSGEHFVLKMLCKHSLDFQTCLSHFETEMALAGKIDHPGLIRKVDQGVLNGCPYYVMEFNPGIDLEAYLVTRGRPEMPLIMKISRQLASALGELHKHGFVHRDIKLKNVILCSDGTVKLIDFGIAKEIRDSDVSQANPIDVVWGTPIYMAPELFFADHDGNVLSEIYSLGASLYHITAGCPLFSADTVEELALKHRDEEPRPIAAFRPDVPHAYDQLIVKKCLAKRPEDRLPSMEAFEEELDRIQ